MGATGSRGSGASTATQHGEQPPLGRGLGAAVAWSPPRPLPADLQPADGATGHPALSWIQLDTFDGNELGSLPTIATKTGDTTHQGRAPFERAAE